MHYSHGVRACYSIPDARRPISTSLRTASEKFGIGEGCCRRHSSTLSTASDVKPINFFSGYCSGRAILTPFRIYYILTKRRLANIRYIRKTEARNTGD